MSPGGPGLGEEEDAMSEQPDRRTFLLGAAALGAGSLHAMQSREIRTAFIGVGNRGKELLRQVLNQANAPVAAICDTNPTARDEAQGLASRYSPRSVTEWHRVADMKDVDAVMIATPCNLHAEIAAACLDAGKYVYCEKPLGITAEEVDRVVKAARRSKAFLQIGQQMRYYPWLQGAIPHIHNGLIGKPLIIKAQRHSTATPEQEKGHLPEWYFDPKISGDRIVENGVHNLDVCNWIAGSLPVSVYGFGKTYLPKPKPPGEEYMDAYSVMYMYENEVNLTYSEAKLHPRALKELANGQWYVVFGEKGAVTIKRGSALFYEMSSESEPRELLTAEQQNAKEDAMGDFFASIREKKEPFAGLRVAATAALTTIMGRKAIYERRMVTWKELGVSI
jgi:myo-inositol 2-dehydrogenase / D-chiro-inositol 1-dehydrogenase